MRLNRLSNLFIPLFCVLILVSCTNWNDGGNEEAAEKTMDESIQGDWTLLSATRNGNKVELPDLYINIDGKTIKSNIQTSATERPFEEGVEYSLVENQLTNTINDNVFDIKRVDDTSMVLSTTLMEKFEFEFEFRK